MNFIEVGEKLVNLDNILSIELVEIKVDGKNVEYYTEFIPVNNSLLKRIVEKIPRDTKEEALKYMKKKYKERK